MGMAFPHKKKFREAVEISFLHTKVCGNAPFYWCSRRNEVMLSLIIYLQLQLNENE